MSGRGRGVEKMNRRADMRGLCGSGSRRAEDARACWAGWWAGRVSWEDGKKRGLAGRLGWLAGAGRAGQACEAFFFPFSFYVLFSFFFI